jgi:hypothetical protein
MVKWIAFYVKYLSQTDLFPIELHGWECEGESPEEALAALEENPAVPYRMFLAEVVPLAQKDIWLEQEKQEAKRIGVVLPIVVMH